MSKLHNSPTAYLFYGVFYNISNCDHFSLLSHPIDSIQGLFLFHRIPLWFHEVNTIGSCKIKPKSQSEDVGKYQNEKQYPSPAQSIDANITVHLVS